MLRIDYIRDFVAITYTPCGVIWMRKEPIAMQKNLLLSVLGALTRIWTAERLRKGCVLSLYKSSFASIIKATTPEEKEYLAVNIGKRIAELRTKNDISQQALADLLFVSRDLVSKWENGMRRPDYQTIERIAEVFRISVDSLIEKKDLIFEELSDCFPEGSELSEERLTAVLNSFLRKSKPRNAELFLKRYYFQNSVTTVADEYGLRENHVRSILSKMRKRLKTEFAKEAHNDG